MKLIRYLGFTIAGLVVVLLLVSIVGLFMAVSDDPLVVDTKKSDARSLLSLKKRVKETIDMLYREGAHKVISIKHHEVDDILAVMSRTFPPVAAKYNYSDFQLLIGLTIKLPSNPIGNYLNVTTEFNDNKNFLSGSTRVGDLTFDNKLISDILFFGASIIIDEDIIAIAEHLLANASYSSDEITIPVDRDIDVRLLVAQLKHNLKMYSNLAWDEEHFSGVAHYYNKLTDFSRFSSGLTNISILDYLKVLYQEAKLRSTVNNPVDENANALIALSLYAGDNRIQRLISHITQVDISHQQPPEIVISNRHDFFLHFLYSATIQILSSKGLSASLGELKEISDMDSGGSGFSFADLAADRAGIQFMTMAMDYNGGATYLQSYLATASSESEFFPDIFGLQEQLSLSDFKTEYQDTESNAYRTVVLEIDRRIQLLPLYRSFGGSAD